VPNEKIPDYYYGAAVDEYDAQRREAPEWGVEQETVRSFVARSGSGARILDVPVGTGRFLSYYRDHSCVVTAVDVSRDMLRRGEANAAALGCVVTLVEGNVLQLPFADGEFDHVVCFRLLTWLAEEEFERALRELRRVARRSMLVSFNTRSHPSFLGDPLAMPRYVKMLRSQRRKRRRPTASIRLHRRSFVVSVLARSGLDLLAEHEIKKGRVSTYSAWELRPR